jgi:hypothetical protein
MAVISERPCLPQQLRACGAHTHTLLHSHSKRCSSSSSTTSSYQPVPVGSYSCTVVVSTY